jgi:hypothetical protein
LTRETREAREARETRETREAREARELTRETRDEIPGLAASGDCDGRDSSENESEESLELHS